MAAVVEGLYVRTDQYRRYGPFASVAIAEAFAFHMNNAPEPGVQEIIDSQTRVPCRVAYTAGDANRYCYPGAPLYDAGVDDDGVQLVGMMKSDYPESRVDGLRIIGYWGGRRGVNPYTGEDFELSNPSSGWVNSPSSPEIHRDGYMVTSGLVQQRVQDQYRYIEGEWVSNLARPGRALFFDETYGYVTGFDEANTIIAGSWYGKSPWLPGSAVHTIVYMHDVQSIDYAA